MGQETGLMNRILLALSKDRNVRLFRNNVGNCWTGKALKMTVRKQVWLDPGDVVIQQGRFFHAGLCVGSSDLIGFKSVEVTPDMVGKKVAIFLAPEIKTATGRPSPEQRNFIKMVTDFGGIAYVATNEVEAVELLNKKT